jgi:hypothetical protein
MPMLHITWISLMPAACCSVGWGPCNITHSSRGAQSLPFACLQDFWNVSAEDPLVHFARFFYGEPQYAVGWLACAELTQRLCDRASYMSGTCT